MAEGSAPKAGGGDGRATCAACGGDVEAGALVAYTTHGFRPLRWVTPPAEERWFGLSLGGAEHRRVVGHRCGKCGRLELFADEVVKRGKRAWDDPPPFE
jgi:hypothetical protein